MTTVAWFHCFSGVAGDMLLGSLIDAGAPLRDVEAVLQQLPLSGWTLRSERVVRGGVAAVHLKVDCPPDDRHRALREIEDVIESALIAPRAKARAVATFGRLAAVEAAIHDCPVDEVHFHEVGAVDAIVDVVGTCVALELLGVDDVYSSAVAFGTGTVRSAHGVLPNPAPATVRLLAGAGAPAYGLDIPIELATPTGAALLAANVTAWGAMPAMTISATGFGAGTKELADRPNVVQAVIGRSEIAPSTPVDVVELATNLDDVTGEVLAHTIAALLAAGALDAWAAPIVMKKGRPAHTLFALCPPDRADVLAALVMRETGALGVRARELRRYVSERRVDTVSVDGVAIRVKVGPYRVKAEHDDVAAAAAALDRPIGVVAAQAEQLWGEQHR